MIGIYSNGYVEVTASKLGFDLVKPYWFTVLKDLEMLNLKYKDNKHIIEIFKQQYIVDCPYIFRDRNKLVFMKDDLFYKTFKYKREVKKMDFIEDKALIKGLLEEGIMPNEYFEVLKIGY